MTTATDNATPASIEKIADKIRKLMKHAESAEAIGNTEEASAFAEKVAKLATEYGLSIEACRARGETIKEDETVAQSIWQPDGVSIKRGGRRIDWLEQLAKVVAHAHRCRFLIATGTNLLWFVGKPLDREVCAFMFDVLARTIALESEREFRAKYNALYKRGLPTGELADFRPSFRNAAIARIGVRYRAMAAAERETHGEAAVTALVRASDTAVQTWMDSQRFKGKAESLHHDGIRNASGAEAGRALGDRVQLRANALRGSSAPTRAALPK